MEAFAKTGRGTLKQVKRLAALSLSALQDFFAAHMVIFSLISTIPHIRFPRNLPADASVAGGSLNALL